MNSDLYAELLPLLDSPSRDPVRETPPTGGRVWSFCPVHADGTKHGKRSLSLHPKIGLDCFASCAFGDIIRALRERAGLHPAHAAPSTPYRSRNGTRAGQLGQMTGCWPYEDETGAALFRVVRLDGPQGKTFLQQHPKDAGGCCGATDDPCKPVRDAPSWRWGHGRGVPHALYRLPELLSHHDARVFVVEGERCADALRELGLTATTSDGGAGKWRPEHSANLEGRSVVLVPDNDRPGAAHMEQAARSLLGVAADVRAVVLPALGYKDDVLDWLNLGYSADQLVALADRAPIMRAPSELFPLAVDTRCLDARGVV